MKYDSLIVTTIIEVIILSWNKRYLSLGHITIVLRLNSGRQGLPVFYKEEKNPLVRGFW